MLQLHLFVFKLHIKTFFHIMLYSLYEVCCFDKSDIKVLLRGLLRERWEISWRVVLLCVLMWFVMVM